MKTEDFDNTRFSAGTTAIYQRLQYEVVSIDFEERLFGLLYWPNVEGPESIKWVRCENVTVVKKDEAA